MSKSIVAIEPARSYDPAEIERAVRNCFGSPAAGDLGIGRGTTVFVKINNLSARRDPESAVNTHPAVLRGVLLWLLEKGARPVVGDDVNGGADPFEIPGARAVCRELGVQLVNLREEGFAEVRIEGRLLSSVFVGRPVLEADRIVNLPKLKTHSLTGLTCAIKNMYGVLPSGERLRLHAFFPLSEPFGQALVDIFAAVRPAWHICDAIVAMEGEGPSSGRPRQIGCLLASRDAVALDAVAADLVGLRPLAVVTTRLAHERGLGRGDPARIETVGAPPAGLRVADFKRSFVAFSLLRSRLPSSLYAFVQGRLVLTPEVDPARCILCRDCLEICPRRTIREKGGAAWIDPSRCIHCLCCHEACPARAIRLKRTPWGALMEAVASAWERAGRLFS